MFTVILDPSKLREKVQRAFIEDHGLLEKTSKNMEISIFNYSIEMATHRKTPKNWGNPYFAVIYSNKMKSVLTNLTPINIAKLHSGELDPKRIAYYTHFELNPEKWKPLLDEKEKQDKHKYEHVVQASTDVFTCGKCREKKCTYYQAQIRSSDEAITTFVTCLVCDNHWTC
jgi:transcription elongation factor S-II